MIQKVNSPIRLSDVALRAGVSIITASRALQTPDKVAPETRRRIEAAAAALGYVPNLIAGALASAQTRIIAVLLPTITSSIFATTINGLTEKLEAEGYAILMAQSGYDAQREKRVLAALLGRRPEGVVMIGSPMSLEATAMLRAAADRGSKVVETWDLPAEPVSVAIGFDNFAVGRAVAERFIKAGRRRLAFVAGDDARADARWQGYTQAAHQAEILANRVILPAPAVMDNALEAYLGATKTSALREADAIFAANDVHAVGLLSALHISELDVPGDVAVIGLGDLELAHHVAPTLTSVRINGKEIGLRAAAYILDGIYGRDAPQHVDLGFEIIFRESG
jgi:LacI family gluconate utilization system Gnt-I transcriptional repressor